MDSLNIRIGAIFALVFAVCGTGLHSAARAASDSSSTIIGDYRYAYHAHESLTQAQEVACREALRLAVSIADPVREQLATADPTLFREVVQTLMSQHLSDYQVVEQYQKGKTVYCKVRASLPSEVVRQVVAAQTHGAGEVKGTPVSTGGLDRNRALQLLAVEDKDGLIVVTYQALRRLDWFNTAYPGSLQGLADIMVDFYDSEGVLIRTDRHPARRTLGGDDVMQPGQIGVLKVPRPLRTASFRVWLVK